jgi:intracellular septation protein A
VKAGLGIIAGIVAATITAGMTTVAVMPLFAMAVAVLITSVALNQADTYWRVKENIVNALKALPEKTATGLYQINTQSIAWKKVKEKDNKHEKEDFYCDPATDTKNLLCKISREK